MTWRRLLWKIMAWCMVIKVDVFNHLRLTLDTLPLWVKTLQGNIQIVNGQMVFLLFEIIAFWKIWLVFTRGIIWVQVNDIITWVFDSKTRLFIHECTFNENVDISYGFDQMQNIKFFFHSLRALSIQVPNLVVSNPTHFWRNWLNKQIQFLTKSEFYYL